MSLTRRFEESLSFPLDDFQARANAALEHGRSVLVCAPTGAGKTVVGEFGVFCALERGGKAFYTTPLRALSNQKFGDFIARYGAERVGLLTGDNSINGEAPIVVMTTEVLRNMLYERSPTLDGLHIVVMDEVHYLKDAYRGATWEEVLIHLPPGVRVAALSATVSNSEEFGAWIRSVRGPTDVVVETTRPVPIEHVYMAGPKLHPMFVRDQDRLKPNPALRRLSAPEPRARRGPRHRWSGPAEGHRRVYRPDRVEVIQRLDAEGMLPAIVFIFSRAGCAAAVQACVRGGVRLTDADEAERIREYVAMRTSSLPQEDHDILGYAEWVDALERGIASHHAGLIPMFKETVEELFERALCKVVFATETLSLGINMPAKTVVLEKLMKFTGERHEMLTPADYTQLTGRAGRRGMDPVGFGVTLYQRDIAFDRIVALAEGRSFPLTSSFRPSYNMAVNLLQVHPMAEAERLLNLSFAQFIADRGVGRQQQQIERNEEFLAGYREHLVPDADPRERETWVSRIDKLTAETDKLRARVRRRTETLARTFERVRAVLERYGYVDGEDVTAKGHRLARIYNESDLLVAEALENGFFADLDPAGLASLVSTLVYQTRIGVPDAFFPSEAIRRAYSKLRRTYQGIADDEQRNKLELVREPDPGFVEQIHRWARGAELEEVLASTEMTAGDFVRSTKQVWDLLRQIAEVAPDPVAGRARDAARAIYRGVVAYSGAL